MAGTGRSRTNVPATIYKDFRPQIERKEEQEANILIIHLPDFPKEQIHLTYVDSSRSVKIQAERALERNTRSRFNQAFPVPEICIIEKIQGSFRNGVLTITMPKRTITQLPLESPKHVTVPKVAASAPAPAPTSISAVEKQTKGKKVEALTPMKQQEETQRKVSPIAKQPEEKTVGSTSTLTRPEVVEKKGETQDGLQDIVKEKTKDSMPESEAKIPKTSEKAGVEKKPGGSSGGFHTIMKTVKKLATDGQEDRQLLINIGVSVLVIVALGAYFTYSYRSSGRNKN